MPHVIEVTPVRTYPVLQENLTVDPKVYVVPIFLPLNGVPGFLQDTAKTKEHDFRKPCAASKLSRRIFKTVK